MKHPLQFILNTEKKRGRSKTHSDIEGDIKRFVEAGGEIQQLQGPDLQPTRQVWTYGEKIGVAQ